MDKFKTEYDPNTGYTKDWYWDQHTKKMYCDKKMDVQSVIDMCKREEAQTHKKSRLFTKESAMGYKAATIPNAITHKIMTEHNVNPYQDNDQLKQFYKIIMTEYPAFMCTRHKNLIMHGT